MLKLPVYGYDSLDEYIEATVHNYLQDEDKVTPLNETLTNTAVGWIAVLSKFKPYVDWKLRVSYFMDVFLTTPEREPSDLVDIYDKYKDEVAEYLATKKEFLDIRLGITENPIYDSQIAWLWETEDMLVLGDNNKGLVARVVVLHKLSDMFDQLITGRFTSTYEYDE